MPADPRHILLLAGTAEARELAGWLAREPGLHVTASLAGATANPAALGVPTRTGGFGGVDGLTAWLRQSGTGLLLDATHPFAASMKAHAAQAAAACGIACVHLLRPAWPVRPGWRLVPDADAAAAAIPDRATAFLALGKRHLSPFRGVRARCIVRSLEPAPAGWPAGDWISGPPGPDVAAETGLLRRLGVSVLVARNSGGRSGLAKLDAADTAGLPVIMIDRPPPPPGEIVTTVEAALACALRRPG